LSAIETGGIGDSMTVSVLYCIGVDFYYLSAVVYVQWWSSMAEKQLQNKLNRGNKHEDAKEGSLEMDGGINLNEVKTKLENIVERIVPVSLVSCVFVGLPVGLSCMLIHLYPRI
jgi:hypothetical protein